MDNFQKVARQLGQNTKIRDTYSVNKKISDSPFDKTFIGRVVDKENFTDRGTMYVSRWIVSAGQHTFKIDVKNANITSIGQQVRVFVPSNNNNSAYAEVINPATAPDKIIYKENDRNEYKDYVNYDEDTVIDSITEKWELADKTYLERLYLLTVYKPGEEDEEVTNIICPDGKIIQLEGFYTKG